jgi:hypothetical protein
LDRVGGDVGVHGHVILAGELESGSFNLGCLVVLLRGADAVVFRGRNEGCVVAFLLVGKDVVVLLALLGNLKEGDHGNLVACWSFDFLEDLLDLRTFFSDEADVVEDAFDVHVDFLDENVAGHLRVLGKESFGDVEILLGDKNIFVYG